MNVNVIECLKNVYISFIFQMNSKTLAFIISFGGVIKIKLSTKIEVSSLKVPATVYTEKLNTNGWYKFSLNAFKKCYK